jgi:hypothetical protein
MRRCFFAMGAALALMAGCASTNQPDQWSAKYHKAGGTPQQLNEDGAACLGASPYPQTDNTAVGVGGFGGLAPRLGDSRLVDVDPFTECMKAKGYTVTPTVIR